MSEKQADFNESWSNLSPETRDICIAIGAAPTGLDTLKEWTEPEEFEKFLSELRERNLLIVRTYREELEEKSKLITQARKEQLIQPERLTPPLTDKERSALTAISALERSDEESLNSARVQLVPDFGEFVDSI